MDATGQPQPPASISAEEFAALAARVTQLEQELASLHAAPRPAPRPIPPPITQFLKSEPTAPPPPPAPADSFETRLGSQIFNRVGIVALLIGVTAFLKLAIDNEWLRPTPMARLLTGLILGTGVILWSERFRIKGFPAFSYSLKAVGTGVLYLSLWAAFQLYHLLPAAVALVLMILVTAWNAWMAWVQDAELLAAYALTGAFATPALLATGGNHELFLFTYLSAIVLSVVALQRFKPWPRLLLGTFPLTVGYFFGWFFRWYDDSAQPEPFALTVAFLVLFWAAFAAVTVLPAEREDNRTSEIIQLLLILANGAFVAVGFAAILESSHDHDWLPWVMVLLSAIYLGLTRLQRNPANAGAHLSLAVVFLTIAIPLKASGRWITVGWLIEGVALLWVSARLHDPYPTHDRTAERLLRLLGASSLGLGFFSLASLPYWLFRTPDNAFLNARFATSLVGIAAFALATFVALQANGKEPGETSKSWLTVAALSTIAVNILAIHAVILEINTFWGHSAELQTALSMSAFLMLYGAALLALGFSRRSAFLRWQGLGLLVFTILKTFTYDVRSLSEGYRVASFLLLGVILMAISFAYQKDWLALRDSAATRDEASL